MAPTTTQLFPLVTSSMILTNALTSYTALSPFLAETPRPQAKQIASTELSSWFSHWFNHTVGPLVACIVTSTAGAYVNRRAAGISPMARKLYGWGGVFAAAHLLFVYPVSFRVKEIIDEGPRDPRIPLKEWLRIHSVRTWTVDLAAVGCFFGALLFL